MSLSWALPSTPVGLLSFKKSVLEMECEGNLLDIDVVLDLVPIRLLWIVLLVREQVINFGIHF